MPEEIALLSGFESFAYLLDISQPDPKTIGDDARWYIAQKTNGNLFLWQDAELSPGNMAHD